MNKTQGSQLRKKQSPLITFEGSNKVSSTKIKMIVVPEAKKSPSKLEKSNESLTSPIVSKPIIRRASNAKSMSQNNPKVVPKGSSSKMMATGSKLSSRTSADFDILSSARGMLRMFSAKKGAASRNHHT